MNAFKNLHAVLVHESRECVLDLVRNLHHLDPESRIVLYNGGTDATLLDPSAGWERYNAVVHPAPRPLKWGWLHDFALDCMRFGLESGGFETLTIVDSDQLALRPGYSEFLRRRLEGKSHVGMLGSAPPPVRGHKLSPPAAHALKEVDLWRPFLRRFENGEQKFVHWTFWPSTVFTANAARALLALWPDPMLQEILARTKIWASEEVILPTLVALLGFGVEVNPCRHDYVRYRVRYTPAQLDQGMANASTFWVHPVPRRPDDPLRSHVRRRHASYLGPEEAAAAAVSQSGVLPILPLLTEIRRLEGWLADDEADLLVATALRALRSHPAGRIVEVGSYCGKATIALARAAEASGAATRVAAIDAHDGVVGARDSELHPTGPTLDRFRRNLARAGLSERVAVHVARAPEVPWNEPIQFLLVDGLHDYASVSSDFAHFEPWLGLGAYVAFHDHADYFPGVVRLVAELVGRGDWVEVRRAGTLVVLERRATPAPAAAVVATTAEALPPPPATASVTPPPPSPAARVATEAPLVSCIMPTADRRGFVAHGIRAFLAQDYAERELVIVDDGVDSIGDLVPPDPRIRYLRLTGRRSVGEKRNTACAAARGAFIAHFDDDDWSGPTRLRYQLTELEAAGADVAGLSRVHYLEPATDRAWQYRYPAGARRWVAGNTLFYRRERWLARPFESVDVGEDARFVWSGRAAGIHAHASSDFFVAMIHGANVGPKRVRDRFWHPEPTAVAQALMGADFDAYRALLDARRR